MHHTGTGVQVLEPGPIYNLLMVETGGLLQNRVILCVVVTR